MTESAAILRRAVHTTTAGVGNAVFVASEAGERTVAATSDPRFDAVSPATAIELASVTKTFLGVLLARLALGGTVGMDEPVGDLLDLGPLAPAWAGVSLRMLATHSGGLPKQPPTWSGPPVNPYLAWNEERLVESIRWGFTPGPRPLYSNFGSAVLGLALTHRTGRPLEDLLCTEVAGPLALDSFGRTSWSERRGYNTDGYRVPVAWSFNGMLGAGGFSASAADLLTLGEVACSRPGGVTGEAVHLTMEPGLPPYTMGWRRHEVRADRYVAWSAGGSAGATAFLAACPDLAVAVAGVANVAAAETISRSGFTALIALASRPGATERLVDSGDPTC